MKIAVNYRFGKDPTGKRTRLYIPSELKEIADEFNICLIPVISENGLDDIVDMCDGLIIPGSYADTDPKYYGEKPLEGKVYDVDEYAFDSKVLEKFYKANKPILGICGGHQEINVYFGGTLKQRIENHEIENTHKANIVEKKSFIYDTYKKDELDINSLHFQAVDKVAPGFITSVVAFDGTIEAIEKDKVLGVQWHPEVMKDMTFFKNYFKKYYNI